MSVVLFSRPGCHLCDDARVVVEKVCAELNVSWVERDITGNAELEQRYRDHVPVVSIDGKEHTYWWVDEAQLKAALLPTQTSWEAH